MIKSDEDNTLLVDSIESVDRLNASFYARFPYPWQPASFDLLTDPDFQRVMINQDLGDWDHKSIPRRPRIWVAGCGTNQAIYTALKLPAANILGSDLSSTSLELCARNADQLAVRNIELQQESLNQADYKDRFDYIICTGVIHHNADPGETLSRIASALKPDGILELMVYNRFHWVIPVAFQQAIRILGSQSSTIDFESDFTFTKKLINDLPENTILEAFVSRYQASDESQIADELFQPVLHSYTVDSLAEMAAGCNLELVAPFISQYDKQAGTFLWNMSFTDPSLREVYESLPDTQRWQVSNLLLLDRSPMLWFYLRRRDDRRPPKSEQQICREFLDTRFVRAATMRRNYLRAADGSYGISPNATAYPAPPADHITERLVTLSDGKTTMRELFAHLELDLGFHSVNTIRLKTTTTAFPYLRATQEDESGAPSITGDEKRRLEQTRIERFRRTKARPISIPGEKDNRR